MHVGVVWFKGKVLMQSEQLRESKEKGTSDQRKPHIFQTIEKGFFYLYTKPLWPRVYFQNIFFK